MLRRARGVTLIELLVAVVIGLILTAGVTQIFISSQSTYRFQESLSRVQETGRFALGTVARDLRNADFRGCGGRSTEPSNLQNLLDDGNPTGADFFREAVMGFTEDGGWSPALPGAISGATPAPDSDSDVLRVRSARGGGAAISDHQSKGRNLFVDDATGIGKGDVVIAGDCDTVTVFQVTSMPAKGKGIGTPLNYNPGMGVTPGNRNADMPKEFNGGEVTAFSENAYYVADSATGANEPALFRLPLSGGGGPEELVTGVERLAFQFGEDTDGDFEVDVYRTADSVVDWEDVVAARVSVLVRGQEDNVVEDDVDFVFPPGVTPVQTLSFTDGRLRQLFSTTVSLRNRLP